MDEYLGVEEGEESIGSGSNAIKEQGFKDDLNKAIIFFAEDKANAQEEESIKEIEKEMIQGEVLSEVRESTKLLMATKKK